VSRSLLDLIAGRLAAAGLDVPETVVERCGAYLELLARWNRRINLTALPLPSPIPATTVDKLIVEPLVAAPVLVSAQGSDWFDLGSGGGSPAIPLRMAYPSGRLTMVEARERKCAFLREAVRVLALADTDVLNVRFEELQPLVADVVTVRAVRVDADVAVLLSTITRAGATVLSFGSDVRSGAFTPGGLLALPDGSKLYILRRD
jgi:16S rRNA (guanine527-N7)-methyltransferase